MQEKLKGFRDTLKANFYSRTKQNNIINLFHFDDLFIFMIYCDKSKI